MKDWTREILLQKFGSGSPKPVVATDEQQPEAIYKAAGEFPDISDYKTIGEWLKAVVAATKGWPEGIRQAVVAEQLSKHRRLKA